MKRTGELTHPCGAPVLMNLESDVVRLTLTCCVLFVIKEKKHLIPASSLIYPTVNKAVMN